MNLIEDALGSAIHNLKGDVSMGIEAALDRDTAGLAGSPTISDYSISRWTSYFCAFFIMIKRIACSLRCL